MIAFILEEGIYTPIRCSFDDLNGTHDVYAGIYSLISIDKRVQYKTLKRSEILESIPLEQYLLVLNACIFRTACAHRLNEDLPLEWYELVEIMSDWLKAYHSRIKDAHIMISPLGP